MEKLSPILRALQHFDNQSQMARAVGVTQPAIHKIVRLNRVTAEMAVKIETATNGKVMRHELRPDLWPATGAAA